MSKKNDSAQSTLLLRLHLPGRLQETLPYQLLSPLRTLRARLLSRRLPCSTAFKGRAVDASASSCMSVVVPIHDAPLVTRRCLASVEKFAALAEVILVDDGSKLHTTQNVIQDFAVRNGWRVVCHDVALGHSRACEAGAALATRSYLCFLNTDTVVTPWCWELMRDAFATDCRIGVVGPSTSSYIQAQGIPLAGYCAEYWNDLQISAFARLLMDSSPSPQVVDLPLIIGSAFLIRRDLWEELEGFDPNLPDYGNEEELCRRVVKMGYRTVWVRRAYIHHLGEQSYVKKIGKPSIQERKRLAKRYIIEKHGPEHVR